MNIEPTLTKLRGMVSTMYCPICYHEVFRHHKQLIDSLHGLGHISFWFSPCNATVIKPGQTCTCTYYVDCLWEEE